MLLCTSACSDSSSSSVKELEVDKKLKENAAYLAKIDRADKQMQEGNIIVKTLDELEAMAE